MPSDHEIRTAIAGVVETAAPNAIVFSWWVLGFDVGQWAGLLASADDSNRSHGWVITRKAILREEGPNGVTDRTATYAVWGFHYYTTGNETANTEDVFQAEVDAVADALVANAVTGVRLEPVQFPTIDLGKFGEELLHFARGELVVKWCA